MSEKEAKKGRPFAAGLFKQYDPAGKYDLDIWRNVFIEVGDPTEYQAAIILADSWEQWNQIKKLWPHFRNVILPSWLEEVEIKLRSEAIRSLITQSKSDKGTVAAKWIAEGRHKQRGPGKPSKAEVQKEARIAAGVHDEVADDVARLEKFIGKENNG